MNYELYSRVVMQIYAADIVLALKSLHMSALISQPRIIYNFISPTYVVAQHKWKKEEKFSKRK